MNYVSSNPSTVGISELYPQMVAMVSPRPIAFVSTVNKDGSINLAPFSFFMVASIEPLVLMIAPLRPRSQEKKKKDTLSNIEREGVCIIYPVLEENKDLVNLCSADLPYGDSEVGYLQQHNQNISFVQSGTIEIIEGMPFAFECELAEPVNGPSIISFGEDPMAGDVIFLKVSQLHIHKNILDAEGKVMNEKLSPLGRSFGNFWVRQDLFQMPNERKVR